MAGDSDEQEMSGENNSVIDRIEMGGGTTQYDQFCNILWFQWKSLDHMPIVPDKNFRSKFHMEDGHNAHLAPNFFTSEMQTSL